MAVDLSQYPSAPSRGFAGQLAHPQDHYRVGSALALAVLAFGVPVFGVDPSAPDQGVYPPGESDAADPDGIVTARPTDAVAETLSGVALNGVIGGDDMFPPRNITITATNHADYDLTTWYVRGLDEEGRPQEEAFVMPNGGNTTLTGKKFFSKVTEVYIPAQSGAGGSTTIGFGAKLGPVDLYLRGVSLYDATKAPGAYGVHDSVPICEEGAIYVYSETAVDPTKPVLVRLVATGLEVRGAFRATPDADDCAQILRARWIDKTSGAGVAALRLLP